MGEEAGDVIDGRLKAGRDPCGSVIPIVAETDPELVEEARLTVFVEHGFT